jgi:hypothetical protein
MPKVSTATPARSPSRWPSNRPRGRPAFGAGENGFIPHVVVFLPEKEIQRAQSVEEEW